MFELDSTLRGDSVSLVETDKVLVRLINDARYPWVIIVPCIENASELADLSDAEFVFISNLTRDIARDMSRVFAADKINTAAIGNVVRQLHIHVVARTVGDAAWPRPVWGIGEMEPMSDAEIARRTDLLRGAESLRLLAGG